MKRLMIIAAAGSLLMSGCGQDTQRQEMNAHTKQNAVREQQLINTLGMAEVPMMVPDMMHRSDQELVAWVKQIDLWTHQILSAPITGTMDARAAGAMKERLMQVFAGDTADDLIAYFYDRDPVNNVYRANSPEAMLNLRSEWTEYQVGRTEEVPGVYTVTITGRNNQAVDRMMHRSMYQLKDGKLQVIQFETASIS